MSLVILARHAQSALNLEGRVNGDPKVDVKLTARGVEQARELGLQLSQLPIDLCVHTRFARTRRTAEIALPLGLRPRGVAEEHALHTPAHDRAAGDAPLIAARGPVLTHVPIVAR